MRQPGEETIGKELWELTWAVIENFKFCPKLKEDLFGGTNDQPQQPEQQLDLPAPPHPHAVDRSGSSGPSQVREAAGREGQQPVLWMGWPLPV